MNTKLDYKLAVLCLTGVELLTCLLLSGIVNANPVTTQLNTEASEEIELSPKGREILCKRSPLNSHCQGSAEGATPSDTSGSGTTETETTPPTDATSPTVPGGADLNNRGISIPASSIITPRSLPGRPTTPRSLPGRPTTFPRTP